MKNKWKATTWTDKEGFEHYSIERTHPIYGYPAVEVAETPKLQNIQQAKNWARKLNGENEQLKLFN